MLGRRTADGDAIFAADTIGTYTIDDIIAAHGPRVPAMGDAQWDFRAAVILLTDRDHPCLATYVGGTHLSISHRDVGVPNDHRHVLLLAKEFELLRVGTVRGGKLAATADRSRSQPPTR